MSFPLIALAIPTVLAGVFGINHLLDHQFGVEAHGSHGVFAELFAPFGHSPFAAIFGVLAVVFGASFAWALYGNAERDPLPKALGFFSRAMARRFYFDEIWSFLIRITHEALSYAADFIDRWLVSGLMVRGTHGGFEIAGRALRLLQSGNIQTYALLFVAGLVVVLLIVLK